MLNYEDAIAQLGAPGQPFEVIEVERAGVTNRVFKNAPATLRQFFDLARGNEKTFLVYEDEEWTFAQVMSEVDALSHALVHHYGLKKGDRVGIAMRNYPEWVISFAAIISVGMVSVSLNAWWTEDELDYAIRDSGLVLLIGDSERILRSARPCERVGARLLGVRLGDTTSYAKEVERWSDVVVRGVAMPEADVDADTDATILYTSGTTGIPKGAVSTNGAITQAILAFSSSVALQSVREGGDALGGAGPNPCLILIVPLFHVTGCVPVMLSCFSWHFKLVMMYKWDPERALQLIERHRVSAFVGVPTQSWDLIESPNFSKYDTSSLTTVGGGGAPAPSTLVGRVERAFANGRATLAFGMTETNAYGPGLSGDDYVTHPSATGQVPTIVMDVEIRDESMRPLPRGKSGEIWLKSPTTVRGYWQRPKETAAALVEGWLRTGDLGHVSEEGFLYVEDRAKDMILRGGENVYSAQVESAIYEHPAVYEAAVFALPNERLGEEVAAAVMLRPGMSLTTEELRSFLATRLAAYMIPSRVAFTSDPLPRNPAGKYLKREMPARYFSNAT
ncbi:MAG: long-chain fatty acid--CoA ligase [Acidimicrobiaceae bacterium]|nr:long-chain fatty acid--CoA ligase [Acidimicrobiaceae bacterium]